MTDLPAPISDAIEDFTITKRLEEGRSDSTVKAYTHDLQAFFSFVLADARQAGMTITSIAGIKTAHVKRFLLHLDEKGYTKRGLARKIATLKSFFHHAQFMGSIETNPMDRIKTPRISSAEHLPKFLTTDEARLVLDHTARHRWAAEHVMVRFMYATMCRVSELCALRVRDLDLERGAVHLRGKGNKERWVPVDPGTMTLVTRILFDGKPGPDDPLFRNKRGRALTPRVVQAMFQEVKRELGLPASKALTPHVLRHTGATMLRRNGMDISELQDLLGHASPNTTRIYAKNDIETLHASYSRLHPLNKD